jgi:hypothetical protein
MGTQVRKGIEIFATGTWNKGTFTSEDLDAMVESFNALDLSGKVPLKLGHEGPDGRLAVGERDKKTGNLKNPLSQLAMGWVTRIYREGNRLMADIEVPDQVAKLMDDKYIKFVSVELFEEVRASRAVFPWVLDAVALLGTDTPAVGILNDIQTLAMKARPSMDAVRHLMFARESHESIIIGEKRKMAKENEGSEDQSLADQVLKLSQRMAALEQENSGLKIKVGEGEQAARRLKEFKDESAKKEREQHRKEIKNRLEGAVKEMEITPAARDRFLRSYKVEDDVAVMEVDMEGVEEFIKENPNPNKPKRVAKQFSVKSADDDLPDNVPADEGVVALTFAHLNSQGVKKPTDEDFERAAIQVLRANKPASDKYKKFTLDAHGVNSR